MTNRFRRAFAALCGVSLCALAVAGCGASSNNGGGGSDAGPSDLGGGQDTGNAVDAGVAPQDVAGPVDSGPPVRDSGCPAPPRITPQNLPAGFLQPRTVQLIRTVDGDTSHFTWPIVGELTVRFLWVNTEESHGAETTQFGVVTAQQVDRILHEAREFVIAPQENANRPGQAATDQFGRTLALVFADGELFQTRLVRDGWSAYYTDFGCAPGAIHASLLYAEAEARANQRGIWRPGHPTNYATVFNQWIPQRNACRPNPFRGQAYCP